MDDIECIDLNLTRCPSTNKPSCRGIYVCEEGNDCNSCQLTCAFCEDGLVSYKQLINGQLQKSSTQIRPSNQPNPESSQTSYKNDDFNNQESVEIKPTETHDSQDVEKTSSSVDVPQNISTSTNTPSIGNNNFNDYNNNNKNSNNNSNNNGNSEKKVGISNQVIIGSAIGGVVLVLLSVVIFMFIKKSKRGKEGKERNINDAQGYDKLHDENFSNYRSMTNSSFHAPSTVEDPNPYAKIPNIEDIPTMDSILIENKKISNTPKVNPTNSANMYSNEIANQANKINSPNVYSTNEMMNQANKINSPNVYSTNEMVNKTNMVNNNVNMNGMDSFSKNNTSYVFESGDVSFHSNSNINYENVIDNSFSKRPISRLGSNDLHYNASRDITQKTIDIQPMSATVTTATALYTSASTNSDTWNYDLNTKVNGENLKRVPNIPITNEDESIQAINTNALHFESKQSYNNMPYNSPVQNNDGVAKSKGDDLYVYTNKNNRHSMNPFSDSHATHTPTNGYVPDLQLNTNFVDDLSRQDSNNSNNDNSIQNQSFSNVSNTYGSYINSPPVTPKSINSLKSNVSKHQSLVTSPSINRKNMKRATITSPTHESFANVINPIAIEAIHSGVLRSPTTPKTPRSATPSLPVNDSRNNMKVGPSPGSVRTPTPSGYSPNLERKPSNKSVHNNFTGTPGMSQRSYASPSELDYKVSHNITMETIPSGMHTLERHYSGRSKFSTATLERVPSNGVSHSDSLGDNISSGDAVIKNNNLMVMSPTSLTKSSSLSGRSPSQPKSILKNANSVNSTKLPSTTSPEISKSQSLRRKKSKGRKQTNDVNVAHYPSMSRKSSSGVLRGDSMKSVPTTPLRPPQLTVFGHAVATPPTPKSSRFPQDIKVLPPVERAILLPPDVLGGTESTPLNTMTLQRKHFHKRNKSVNAATLINEYNIENNVERTKSSGDHPLPVPPPHQKKKSNDEVGSSKVSERVGRSRDQSTDDYHYRSRSLPRPNKYNHNVTRYVDDSSYYQYMEPSPIIKDLTSFEIDYLNEREVQGFTKIRSSESVLSILKEEKANMDYYLLHCDD
ncbi:hypothetical protein PIROE2DRAFT_16860 [Piromyces sp. E2]|nr:hypothetical protein PIROE2DRAFT_16860 [Piromyces sp. E2]|eukprot:OUM57985.1 hypothetical protein PIROE2DRAFT_16860 [Piromyces sp. E2]